MIRVPCFWNSTSAGNIGFETTQETDCKFITYLAKQQINQGKTLKKLKFLYKHNYFCSKSFNYYYFCKQLQYNPKNNYETDCIYYGCQ